MTPSTAPPKSKKTVYINSAQYYRENFNRCHYCDHLNTIYRKYYSSEDTAGNWVRLAVPFTSCSREDCPYHFHLVEGIIQRATEKIRWERGTLSAFFADPEPIEGTLISHTSYDLYQ